MDKSRITIRLNQPKDQNIQAQIEPMQSQKSTQPEINRQDRKQESMDAVEMEIRKANEIQKRREKELDTRQEHRVNSFPEIEIEESRTRSNRTTKQPKIISWFASSEDTDESTKRHSHTSSYRRKSSYSRYPRKKSSKTRGIEFQFTQQVWKTIGVGIGAIATGVLFGFILLHFFITPMLTGTDSIQTNTNIAQPGNSQAIIPQKDIYLLQAGVFSDKTGADAAVEELKKTGKAGIVKEADKNYVFVGIAPDKTQGQVLVDQLKAGGQQTYLKTYTIKEYQATISNEAFQKFITWNNTGDQMVNWLAANTISLLKDPKVAIEDKEIQKLHQQFLTDAQALQTQLGKEGKTKEQQVTKAMADQMNYAMTAYTEYRKSGSVQYLWNVQNSLMGYEMAYESLGQ